MLMAVILATHWKCYTEVKPFDLARTLGTSLGKGEKQNNSTREETSHLRLHQAT